MTTRFKDGIQRYCLAVFFTFGATWLRLLLADHVGDRVPFATYLVSVLLTACTISAPTPGYE